MILVDTSIWIDHLRKETTPYLFYLKRAGSYASLHHQRTIVRIDAESP